jgi:O-antigen/teichoic acid export membrane protein
LVSLAPPPTAPPSQAAPAPSRAGRVVRNAASPFAARLFLSLLNLGYYIVQVHLITQGALDQYIYASLIWVYASTITDWGLGTLLTRNLAQARQGETAPGSERAAARRLFAETFGLRLALSAAALVPLVLLAWTPPGQAVGNLTPEGSWAILLLGLSLLPGSFSAAASALYYAYERMVWPSAVQTVTGVLNVVLGIGALLLGWGVIGLAGAALATTLITAGIFYRQMRRDFFAPALAWPPAAVALLATAFPLMVNGLLVTIFFRFDQLIIKAVRPEGEVTLYETAYKFINFTLIITPSVTLALFPGMAHAAVHDRAALARHYRAGLKVLLLLACPIVAVTVALAPLLIQLVTFGKGAIFLPYSAWALQILILFLPFSFINGLTQYVLIALDRQRWLTGAFMAAAVFNVGVNLLVIPVFGIYGAAAVTILSELVLLGPFLWWTARDLGPGVLRPGAGGLKLAVAAGLLGLVTGGGLVLGVPGWIVAPVGVVVYGGCLLALGFFTPAEWALVQRALRRRSAPR